MVEGLVQADYASQHIYLQQDDLVPKVDLHHLWLFRGWYLLGLVQAAEYSECSIHGRPWFRGHLWQVLYNCTNYSQGMSSSWFRSMSQQVKLKLYSCSISNILPGAQKIVHHLHPCNCLLKHFLSKVLFVVCFLAQIWEALLFRQPYFQFQQKVALINQNLGFVFAYRI